jgi:hypothetical protein
MNAFEMMPTREIAEIFAQAITSLDGEVTDLFDDAARLFGRSVLPPQEQVQPGDAVQGGVALMVFEGDVWIHPYVFRRVCTNGAIRAHATQTTRLDLPILQGQSEYFVASLRQAIRACAAPDVLKVGSSEMRSAIEQQADLAITLMPLFSRLPAETRSQVLMSIVERFTAQGDHSRFGLMNAVTSIARDTPDPQIRWRLEEFGGGIPARLQSSNPVSPNAARALVPA